MSRIGVTTEDIMRRLVELERLVGGWPQNDRAHRRRHIVSARPTKGIRIAVLDGDLAHGGSATASVYTANAGTESDSGENVTVYDFGLIGSAKEIVSGTKIFIANVNGYWYVIAAGVCPTTA